MKLQRILLQDGALLQKLVLSQLHDLDGKIDLLDTHLSSEAGPLCLGIDEDRRFVLLISTVKEDDSILVKVLGQLNWVARYHSLLARAFSNPGGVPPPPPRAVLVAPSFSSVFKEAVTFLGLDIELHQFHALEFDRQMTLLFDPVRVSHRSKAQPTISAPVRPTASSSQIELTDEERSFFEESVSKNLPM